MQNKCACKHSPKGLKFFLIFTLKPPHNMATRSGKKSMCSLSKCSLNNGYFKGFFQQMNSQWIGRIVKPSLCVVYDTTLDSHRIYCVSFNGREI